MEGGEQKHHLIVSPPSTLGSFTLRSSLSGKIDFKARFTPRAVTAAAATALMAVPRDGITPTSYIRSGACCFSKGIMYERGEEGGRASARSIASRCIFRLQYLPPSDASLVPRKNRAQLDSRSFRGVPGNCRAIKVLVGARVTRLPLECDRKGRWPLGRTAFDKSYGITAEQPRHFGYGFGRTLAAMHMRLLKPLLYDSPALSDQCPVCLNVRGGAADDGRTDGRVIYS